MKNLIPYKLFESNDEPLIIEITRDERMEFNKRENHEKEFFTKREENIVDNVIRKLFKHIGTEYTEIEKRIGLMGTRDKVFTTNEEYYGPKSKKLRNKNYISLFIRKYSDSWYIIEIYIWRNGYSYDYTLKLDDIGAFDELEEYFISFLKREESKFKYNDDTIQPTYDENGHLTEANANYKQHTVKRYEDFFNISKEDVIDLFLPFSDIGYKIDVEYEILPDPVNYDHYPLTREDYFLSMNSMRARIYLDNYISSKKKPAADFWIKVIISVKDAHLHIGEGKFHYISNCNFEREINFIKSCGFKFRVKGTKRSSKVNSDSVILTFEKIPNTKIKEEYAFPHTKVDEQKKLNGINKWKISREEFGEKANVYTQKFDIFTDHDERILKNILDKLKPSITFGYSATEYKGQSNRMDNKKSWLIVYYHGGNLLNICKAKDEWFYINGKDGRYKCDQISDLLEFLETYFFDDIKSTNEALKISQYRPFDIDFDREIHNDIFRSFKGEHDKNYYRLYLPVTKSKSETEIKITELLNKNGYEIVSYLDGRARYKGARNATRINQILPRIAKQNPEDANLALELSKMFVEDPTRKAGEDLMVCITRHAYDIAGADTDRNWNNCLTLGREDSKRYKQHIEELKKELKNINIKEMSNKLDKMLEEDESLSDIEKDEVIFDTHRQGDHYNIIKELEKYKIDIPTELLCKYEDENEEVDTDNTEFNQLATKYNYIIDMISKIGEFITSGTNVEYIHNHIKLGVIMTYLIRSNDKNIQDPIANLDIKPYFNIFDPTEIFLLQDVRVYGHGTDDYKKTVENWLKEINKGKVGIFKLVEGLYNDNLSNKTIIVKPNGSIIRNATETDDHGDSRNKVEGYELDPKTIKLYKNKINSIKSDKEAEEYIQYVLKSLGSMSIGSDIRMDILLNTPKKWEHLYKKTRTRNRFNGW